VYSATKAGVIALNKALTREYGKYGVRFNSIAPGVVVPSDEETGSESMWTNKAMKDVFTPEVLDSIRKKNLLRRLGNADDVANGVAFLSSDKCARMVAGQTLSVSGGYSML
jgi:2-hydroxycyclohexanecarboxyl-CoA dehydrogenase